MLPIASEPAEDPANPITAAAAPDRADNVLPLPGPGLRSAALARYGAALDAAPQPRELRPLGQILLEDGAVSSELLLRAAVLRRRQDARLEDILLAQGWVTEDALTRALARQWRTNTVDLQAQPPDPRLIDELGAEFCMTHALVPWRRTAGLTWVATARPEAFARLSQEFPEGFGNLRMLLCSEVAAQEAILLTRRTQLIRAAEARVPAPESCRQASRGRATRIALGAMAMLAFGLVFAPVAILAALAIWVMGTLVCVTVLKALCFAATLAGERAERRAKADLAALSRTPPEMTGPLPLISVMVPMFAESDIAERLVGRLARLTYPRELTDILLVIEEGDRITRDALAVAGLPRWIRVVTVPDGPIRTKPRALNYALNFCRGQIIGVWDAEDAPEPEQLHKVARRFHFAPEDVACLQGALDFYNPRTNWLARCFTVEYAGWFRAILPGAARLGLVIPLGGTTLFCRRAALEQVGAWDAWNVTEDADLGVRFARRGLRTEMLDTTTDEEANCRTVPWVKQRSRWIKGHALTWAVHMRDPRRLLAELGAKRFIAFQVQFLGSLSQYLLAPVLLSFWLIALGLPHPLAAPLSTLWPGHAVAALVALLLSAEAVNIAIGLWAVRGSKRGHLRLWVPTLHVYHPLGCLAGWKAIYEAVVKPFYWDKTVHGVYDGPQDQAETEALPAAMPQNPAAHLPGTVAIPVLGVLDDGRARRTPPAPELQDRLRELLVASNSILGQDSMSGTAEDEPFGSAQEMSAPAAAPRRDRGSDAGARGKMPAPLPRHLQLSFMRRRRGAA
ncbi:glycosyltransferase [uncultured Paracoccus sp.]|uniref:glycosyltransferase n=1 Tax=uncultured Paracoccus sp. TaxID=189685 RepID=UPI0026066CA5|nr:glycosyltransferase [uncultured Paracoccus sp.]